MTRYKDREEALFARWMQAYKEIDGINPEEDFAFDGLLYRGEFKLVDGCWERQTGNESELWDNAPYRLLVLTKDTTRNGGLDDMRIETGRANHTGGNVVSAGNNFYRNLALWSYALLNAMQGGKIERYNNTPDWDRLREYYESLPIARINCKKQIGESSIADSLLKSHIEKYAVFLKEQIAMYDANIILCCGGRGIIKEFVNSHYLPDLVKFSTAGWIYYSPSTSKVVIDSYHPSALKSMESMYDEMMADLSEFLNQGK